MPEYQMSHASSKQLLQRKLLRRAMSATGLGRVKTLGRDPIENCLADLELAPRR
jgi:hypothetical protein